MGREKEVLMKRFLLLISIMLVALLITGCGGGKTYIDAEETIITSVNQEFVVALDSNPTTGYNWEESHDATMLGLVNERYSPDEKAPGLVGAGGTQYFRFKALEAGRTQITVTYKRSWETETAKQKIFNVDIK